MVKTHQFPLNANAPIPTMGLGSHGGGEKRTAFSTSAWLLSIPVCGTFLYLFFCSWLLSFLFQICHLFILPPACKKMLLSNDLNPSNANGRSKTGSFLQQGDTLMQWNSASNPIGPIGWASSQWRNLAMVCGIGFGDLTLQDYKSCLRGPALNWGKQIAFLLLVGDFGGDCDE